MDEVATQITLAEMDLIAPNGAGSFTGTTETSSACAQDAGSSFLPAAYAVNSDGTFSLSSSGGAVAGIIISRSKFVMLSPTTDATAFPTLLIIQE